jgi:CRP-like cAMP-binding protein
MDSLHSAIQNQLLAAIPKSDLKALLQYFEPMDLVLQDSLGEPEEPIEHAYFPIEGICSIIAVNQRGARIEAGLIGKEGFVGAAIILSVDHAPFQVIVQAPGRALRISRANLLQASQRHPAFTTVLSRFIHVFSIQTAQTALANGRFSIEERLARWLLMCHDRVGSHEFSMTHKFLSVMLAVRRSGVTGALHKLEGSHLIQPTRGKIKILDRNGLEKAAGGAYGVPEQEYERLISKLSRQPA